MLKKLLVAIGLLVAPFVAQAAVLNIFTSGQLVGPPPLVYTFNPNNKVAGISLTNGNLTATVTATGGFPQAMSTVGYSTGKYHIESQYLVGNSSGVGFAQASHAFTTQAGFDAVSIAFYGGNGTLGTYFNSVLEKTGPPSSTDLIAIEVDFGAGKMWAKDVTTNSNWNNDATANPATGTGGAAFTVSGSPTWYVIVDMPNSLTRGQTLNFGATAFGANCSTGFIAWNGSSSACPATGPTTPTTSLHYASGANNGLLGFNLADVSSVGTLDALPAGFKGLAYLGLGGSSGSCVNASDPSFLAAVGQYKTGGVVDPKLWGFYIADEPLIANCTAANLKSDVDYIHANFSGIETFVILESTGSTPTTPVYTGYLTPSNSDLDYVGLDPYPVRAQFSGGINLSVISAAVTAAQVPGWTVAQMIPVYQAFGNYYCTPPTSGTGSISSTTLTISSVTVGGFIAGGIVGTGIAPGTQITSQLTGPTGGAGNYGVTPSQTVTSGTVTQPSVGGADWQLPTLAQETQILQAWGAVTPTPVFEYAYGYNQQCNDQAIVNTGYLQTFYQQRNGAPPPPSITSPAPGATVGTAIATVTGNGVADGSITVCIDGIFSGSSCSGTSGTATITVNLSWTFNTPALGNGSHTVVAIQTNAVGSSFSQPSTPVTFTTNVVAPTGNTWNSSGLPATMSLSTDLLTATNVKTMPAQPQALSTSSHTSGQYHFEIQTSPTGPGSAFGVVTSAHSLSLWPGQDTNASGIVYMGTDGPCPAAACIVYNGSVLLTLGAGYTPGDLLAFEVDFTAGNFKAQDVTQGTGWYAPQGFSPAGSAWFLDFAPSDAATGRFGTLNAGASNFGAACSAGYVAWDGTSTACPAAAPVGTGLTSPPVSLLPSDLPVTHWQTTARPWAALNIPLSSYKSRFMPMVGWLSTNLSGGCLASSWDPYNSTTGADNGAAASAIGPSFTITGDQTYGASTAIPLLNCTTSNYTGGTNNNSGFAVFVPGPTITAMRLMNTFPSAPVSTWNSQMNFLPAGSNTGNQRVIGCWGVWEGHVSGLSAYSGAASYVDNCWSGSTYNLQTRQQAAPWLLFEDQSSTPDTFSVESNGRVPWLTTVIDGYNGADAAAMKNAELTGSLTKLLIQGPSGDVAPNGRTDNHVWVDSADQFGYEELAQYLNTTNSFLAGQYQHAAEMTFNGIGRFIDPQCCNSSMFFITKNHLDPALRESYQTASAWTYNLSVLQYTGFSYAERHKSVVTEQPSPTEVGGYALALNADFNAAFMNAGGTLAQINLSGDSTGASGNYWTAMGINRINRVSWENRLGPSDGNPVPSSQVSFAPTWVTGGGGWTRLAQNPSGCSGNFTTTFANPAVTFGKVVWTCSATSPAVTFTQNLTVTPDGVLSQATCSGCPGLWGMTFPMMVTDGTLSPNVWGATSLTTAVGTNAAGLVQSTWPSSGDQQNYMTIGATPTLVNEGQVIMPFGYMNSIRAYTSGTTQTAFVYPRNSSDPLGSAVQSGMTVTSAAGASPLTYTNSALTSSVVSGSSGTYYIGRTSAGGWAQTITLPVGTISFTASGSPAPCQFIAQINSSGHVTKLEVDRPVIATVQGVAANMSAHVPQSF